MFKRLNKPFYMNTTDEITMTVLPQNPESRWVALDSNDMIISEGKNPNEVIVDAQTKSDNFFMMFIPIEGNTYIF